MNEWPSRAVRISVYMPAQLKKGTEVYAINEIPTSYSFVRYCPAYERVRGQYFIHTS